MADKLRWFPFHIDDWQTDERVALMGPATRGTYLTLLIHQWREGSIPADRSQIKRLLLSPKDPMTVKLEEDDSLDYDAILDQVLRCFEPFKLSSSPAQAKLEVSLGLAPANMLRLVNKRLAETREKQEVLHNSRVMGGKSKTAKRLHKKLSSSPTQAQPKPNRAEKEIEEERELKPPPTPKGDDDDVRFASFWNEYPKKIGKGAALKSWRKINPSKELTNRIISAIASQSESDQWNRDKGQYIPNPATWLNQTRWEDEGVKEFSSPIDEIPYLIPGDSNGKVAN